MPRQGIDRVFLSIVLILLFAGLFIFVSAALGTLARSESKFDNLLMSQLLFGLLGGSVAMYITSRIKYQFWRKNAFWIFLGSVILAGLVFVPGIGMEHGGARRWIDLGITTFQPGEALKFGVIVYLSAWFSSYHKQIHSPVFGLLPFLLMLGITGGLLLAQPDTGTFLIAVGAGTAMFFAAGGKWRYVVLLFVLGAVLIGGLAVWKPYIRDRISTLITLDDFQGSGYQVRQAMIAIGSGEIFGRGFGQSVQKFNYLPEAHGDSIFAVFGEEFGFVGASALIMLYVVFALRGLWIAGHAPDMFSGLLVVGIIILLTGQSFINIGSMINLLPLTGVPLVFVSHGGTALLIAMAEVGILLNISRYRRV
ncbi:MAG: putative peptidoglycan glycosyltransferase FtsW [Candidatus Liptonbacteria bacterium]|nr:putative peptidoglycan glycosyltransferase FtsW [Candidatus Liptonbacteria bacterium]